MESDISTHTREKEIKRTHKQETINASNSYGMEAIHFQE